MTDYTQDSVYIYIDECILRRPGPYSRTRITYDYRRLRSGRDGHLDHSEAYDISNTCSRIRALAGVSPDLSKKGPVGSWMDPVFLFLNMLNVGVSQKIAA